MTVARGVLGAAFVSTSLLQPASAQDIRLAQPIDCELGETCFVQNYVDRDPGPDFQDHRCGTMGYDGHDGTDFRIADLRTMIDGVAVLAAASGRVARVRDGEPDTGLTEDTANDVAGRECGNGVLVEHNGFATLYCHLRQQSIAVEPGQQVDAGTRLGDVGLSGFTEFPHLHFEVFRIEDGAEVTLDPFDGAPADQACGGPTASLWNDGLTDAMAYRERVVFPLGITNGPVTLDGIEYALYRDVPLDRQSPFLVVYARVLGLQEGDTLRVRLLGPDGTVLASHERGPLTNASAQQMLFTGSRRPDDGWPDGDYLATVEIAAASGEIMGQNTFRLTLD
ncbi:MAG: M23 family metallopeptidase [Pseudomonadota bacterium]